MEESVSSEVLSGRKLRRHGNGCVAVDGRIAGLNAADGKRVWMYERSTPALVVRSHAELPSNAVWPMRIAGEN